MGNKIFIEVIPILQAVITTQVAIAFTRSEPQSMIKVWKPFKGYNQFFTQNQRKLLNKSLGYDLTSMK